MGDNNYITLSEVLQQIENSDSKLYDSNDIIDSLYNNSSITNY